MHSPLARRALVAAALLSLLLPVARTARADPPSRAALRIESDGDALEVFERTRNVAMVPVRTGRFGTSLERSPVYAPLCTTLPCDTSLPEGRHALAVSKEGGEIVLADHLVDLNDVTTLHVHYTDRSVVRTLGIVTAIVAPVGGVSLIFAGRHESDCFTTSCSPKEVWDLGMVVAGGVVFLVGLVAGLAMAEQVDSASFTLSPLSMGSVPGARKEGASAVMPSGLALTVRF